MKLKIFWNHHLDKYEANIEILKSDFPECLIRLLWKPSIGSGIQRIQCTWKKHKDQGVNIYIIYQTWWFWTCISGFNYGESLKFHGAQIVSFRYCQFVFFEGVGSACFFFNRGVFRQKTIAFANSWGLSLLAGFPLGSTFAIMDYHGWGHEGLNSLVQHDYESIISGGETTAFWGGPLLSPKHPRW